MARKVEYTLALPDLVGPIPRASANFDKAALRKEVGDFIVGQTRQHMNQQKSPVAGRGKFKALSPEYRDKKKEAGRPGKPDLFFFGKLYNAIKSKGTGNKVTIKVDPSQSDKADGHVNFSGESRIPTRRFIPGEGEHLKRAIESGVKRIVREHIADAEDE